MRGYLICNSCGKNLTASISHGDGGNYLYYHCQSGCKERIEAKTIHNSFEKWLTEISMKPEVAQLYLAVMEDVFKTNGTDREKEVLKLENEIKKNTEMLDRATKKLVNDEIDKDDHKTLKESLVKETACLKIRIADLKETESGFMEYLRFGTTLLGNLPYYYSTATLENKQKIICSIFPEKLIFSENTYRTAKPNEIISLLYYVNKGFKKEIATENGGYSYQVAPPRIELGSKV